jgi:hypothetical protein
MESVVTGDCHATFGNEFITPPENGKDGLHKTDGDHWRLGKFNFIRPRCFSPKGYYKGEKWY